MDGRFYAETSHDPEDLKTVELAQPLIDGIDSSFGKLPGLPSPVNSSYCLSSAAMYHPQVLSYSASTGGRWKSPNTCFASYTSPTVSQCAYPERKTRMIEHNWNTGLRVALPRSGSVAQRVQRLDLDSRHQTSAQRIQDALRSLHGNAVVLVSLVAGDHGLVHAEASGKLPLGHAAGDAEADEHLPEAPESLELAELAALETFVPPDLLHELHVEGFQRHAKLCHLLGRESPPAPGFDVLGESPSLGIEPGDGLLTLGFGAEHGAFGA